MSQPQYTPANPYPAPGEVLDGKYRVEHLLGEGGMGAVAKATHMLRRAPVALKFMSPAVLALQGAVERFVNEGVAASQIDSDHVVKVFDVGRMPSGAPYLVMEYLDGRDLGQLLAMMGGRLDITRTVHFALQILRALQTAHAAGIIHRDMKPSNCFVIDKDGEPDFVKLVDFGISKVRNDDSGRPRANLTQTNSALGTPLYMAPEQARSPKDVDQRADLYSVGAIMYELVTGRTPYTCESGEYTEILFKIFTTEPDPVQMYRPDLPDGLAAVIHRALVRDPNNRYSSASEFAEALVPFADERSAQIIARVRGGRGRSILPNTPVQSTSQPGVVQGGRVPTGGGVPSRTSLVSAGGVPAATYPNANQAIPALRVPTDVGVTSEAGAGAAGKGGRIALVAAFGAIVLIGAVGGILVIGRTKPAIHPTHDPPVTSTPATVASVPTGPPSAELTPLPSATVPPSATPSASVVIPPPPINGKHPPGGLVNVQPHF
jgi:eukaryotic-like serine/threonine-protein kinase